MDGNNIRTPADGQSEGRPASATRGTAPPGDGRSRWYGSGVARRAAQQSGHRRGRGRGPRLDGRLPRCKRRERRGAGDQPRARRQPGVHPVEPHGVPPHGYGPSAGGGSARRPVRTPPGARRRTPRHARRVRGVRRRAVFRGPHHRTRRPGCWRGPRRSEQPRPAQRDAPHGGPGARHRRLGGTGVARHAGRAVRRRLAGRPRLLARDLPPQRPAAPGRDPGAPAGPGERRHRGPAVARRGGCRPRRRRPGRSDRRVDRGRQARLDEPQGARRTGRGSGVPHRAGADRAPSPHSDAEAVAVRVASVLRDQCRDRPALRSPVRGDLPAHPAMRAHPGVHGRAGGRRAYPVLRDLHRAFPCQWGRAGAGRPAPAHDRRHGHLRRGLPVARPGPLRELCRGDPARCGPLGCRAGLGGDPADCRRAGPRSATPTSARPPPSTTSPPVWAEPS